MLDIVQRESIYWLGYIHSWCISKNSLWRLPVPEYPQCDRIIHRHPDASHRPTPFQGDHIEFKVFIEKYFSKALSPLVLPMRNEIFILLLFWGSAGQTESLRIINDPLNHLRFDGCFTTHCQSTPGPCPQCRCWSTRVCGSRSCFCSALSTSGPKGTLWGRNPPCHHGWSRPWLPQSQCSSAHQQKMHHIWKYPLSWIGLWWCHKPALLLMSGMKSKSSPCTDSMVQ